MKEAPFELIEYTSLAKHSEAEIEKLYKACREDGFFYMNLQGAAPNIMAAIRDIFELDKRIYDLPLEEKLRYDIDKLTPETKLNGYKPLGRNFGGLSGSKDGFETYALPKDGIMGITNDEFLRPRVVDEFVPSLKVFCSAASAAVEAILSSLSIKLSLPKGKRLEDMHRTKCSTPDVVRLLKYCALPANEVGDSHTPHTDLGSITILFSEQPGLQVKRSQEDAWEAVAPRPGYAVVNLGDAIWKLTGGHLKSCLHRVVLPVQGEGKTERYSFAYLSRPEKHVLMKPVSSPLIQVAEDTDGEILTGADWLQNKYKALRADTRNEDNAWRLTGGR